MAVLSAVAYGAADFLGGMAAKRATTLGSVVVTQAAGLILLLIVLPVLPAATVTAADLAWGAAAGLAGGGGVALLYRALAIGPMSVVAPLTAVCAAAIPVAIGLALGDRLTPLTAIGIVLAIAAIVLIGQERPTASAETRTRAIVAAGVRLALAAGIAVGLFFVCLERTSATSGLWPLVPSRIVSIALFSSIARATSRRLLVPVSVMPVALGGGALDMLANAFYLIAVQQGQLSVVATLASLYPASTIILARIVLDERWSRLQAVGILTAVVATMMIVAGTA